LIINNYLKVYYDYKLPLLVYTDKGWAIEKETYACELIGELYAQIEEDTFRQNMVWLNEKDRPLILLLLDKIGQTQDPRFLPLLTHWKSDTFIKIATRIKQVSHAIREHNGLWEKHQSGINLEIFPKVPDQMVDEITDTNIKPLINVPMELVSGHLILSNQRNTNAKAYRFHLPNGSCFNPICAFIG
jgi:hypothetical protein